MKRLYTIKELADEAGVSTSALRAWERRFAIFSPDRTPGGHRLYSLDDLKIVWFVKKQQELGFDLKEISQCGRSALLQAARSFFTQESQKNGENQSSSEGDIVSALKHAELHRAQRMLENLYSVSTSAIDFATSAISIRQQLLEADSLVKPYNLTFFKNLASHHCLDSILHARTTPKGLALCLNYAQQNNLPLLRVALYLRSWGYGVTFVNRPPHAKDLAELLDATKPLLACVGFSQDSLSDVSIFTRNMASLAEKTLCCLLQSSPNAEQNAAFAPPENAYVISSILELEMLALQRFDDMRTSHIDVLNSFQSKFR
jgi:DNA-binding transcriptional MerR regulator